MLLRVYFDANIVIYLSQGYREFADQLARLRTMIADREIVAVTSELSLSEALVMPFKRNDEAAELAIRNLLVGSRAFELLSTTRSMYEYAARVRADFGLKAPDAIHVSTALHAQCDLFLTNDQSIKLPEGMGMWQFKDVK